jgi:hypothetical protein
MAEEAQKLAVDASNSFASSYLKIAEEWRKLATEIESGRV